MIKQILLFVFFVGFLGIGWGTFIGYQFGTYKVEGHRDPVANKSILNSVYFAIVTMFTIGYGDLFPDKTNILALILTMSYVLYWQCYGHGKCEWLAKACIEKFERQFFSYDFYETRTKRVLLTKRLFSIYVVLILFVIGLVGAMLIEKLDWFKAWYLVLTSSSTVGYGDVSFQKPEGRCFAVVWLTLCGLMIGTAFSYFRVFVMSFIMSFIGLKDISNSQKCKLPSEKQGHMPDLKSNKKSDVIGPEERPGQRRIGVALSFINSLPTISWVRDRLDVTRGDKVHIIHVAPNSDSETRKAHQLPLNEFVQPNIRLEHGVVANIEGTELDGFYNYMVSEGVTVEVQILYGIPKKKLLDSITDLNLTHLVMGRKNTHIIRRLLVPKISAYVLKKADIPVSTVSETIPRPI